MSTAAVEHQSCGPLLNLRQYLIGHTASEHESGAIDLLVVGQQIIISG